MPFGAGSTSFLRPFSLWGKNRTLSGGSAQIKRKGRRGYCAKLKLKRENNKGKRGSPKTDRPWKGTTADYLRNICSLIAVVLSSSMNAAAAFSGMPVGGAGAPRCWPVRCPLPFASVVPGLLPTGSAKKGRRTPLMRRKNKYGPHENTGKCECRPAMPDIRVQMLFSFLSAPPDFSSFSANASPVCAGSEGERATGHGLAARLFALLPFLQFSLELPQADRYFPKANKFFCPFFITLRKSAPF